MPDRNSDTEYVQQIDSDDDDIRPGYGTRAKGKRRAAEKSRWERDVLDDDDALDALNGADALGALAIAAERNAEARKRQRWVVLPLFPSRGSDAPGPNIWSP